MATTVMEREGAVAQPDPAESAREAGLRYVTDSRPGFTRRRRGKGFTYLYPDGEPLKDEDTLARIRSLAIPPAWTDVWISPSPRGHIQATGRDARGRKQYRYHPKWREVRDANKYDRMVAFGLALPAIRKRTDEDLAKQGLPREKVLAAVVRLLEATLIRVGNDEYARENRSYGLTTLTGRHADVEGSTIAFTFRGKGGKMHRVEVTDRRLSRIVRRCQDLPGQELFQYVDEDGAAKDVGSSDVNEYLREITNTDFHGEGFPYLGRNGCRGVGPGGARGVRLRSPGQAEHRRGHREGGLRPRQHPRRVPHVLCPPGCPRRVHGRVDAQCTRTAGGEDGRLPAGPGAG